MGMVLIVVLFVPITAKADPPVVAVIIEDWGVSTDAAKREDGSVFAIASVENDLLSVRGTARLYLKPNVSIEEIDKVPCGVIINRHKVSNISEHLIDGSYGPELWFSHIPKGVMAKLAMFTKEFPKELYAATFEVTSDQGHNEHTWSRDPSQNTYEILPFVGYQEVTLDDVCEMGTPEAFQGFEYPKS